MTEQIQFETNSKNNLEIETTSVLFFIEDKNEKQIFFKIDDGTQSTIIRTQRLGSILKKNLMRKRERDGEYGGTG